MFVYRCFCIEWLWCKEALKGKHINIHIYFYIMNMKTNSKHRTCSSQMIQRLCFFSFVIEKALGLINLGRVFLVSEPNNENTNNQWPPMNCRCKQFQENIEAVYLQWLNIISYHQCGCEQELDGKFIAKVKFSWKKKQVQKGPSNVNLT